MSEAAARASGRMFGSVALRFPPARREGLPHAHISFCLVSDAPADRATSRSTPLFVAPDPPFVAPAPEPLLSGLAIGRSRAGVRQNFQAGATLPVGLSPAIPERPSPSCPDLFRASMRPPGVNAKVDARNQSGHDEERHDEKEIGAPGVDPGPDSTGPFETRSNPGHAPYPPKLNRIAVAPELGPTHGSRCRRSRWRKGSNAEAAARTEAGPRLGGRGDESDARPAGRRG